MNEYLKRLEYYYIKYTGKTWQQRYDEMFEERFLTALSKLIKKKNEKIKENGDI